MFEGNLVTNRDTRHIPPVHFPGWTDVNLYPAELADLPMEFERCTTYGFRGDTRGPAEVQEESNGFFANWTRPSHIAQAVQQQQVAGPQEVQVNDPMNLPRFLANPQLGEFVSTCKSVAMARYFATSTWTPQGGMVPGSTDGWVYACFVEAGIHIPPAGGQYFGQQGGLYQVPYNEQEVAMPGGLGWKDVIAARRVLVSGHFTGPIYVHPQLGWSKHAGSAPQIYDLLSGMHQGPGNPGEWV